MYMNGHVSDEIILHHDGVPLGYSNAIKPKGNRILKIDDFIGRALPYIGPYKKLSKTQQVVALIDDVSFIYNDKQVALFAVC